MCEILLEDKMFREMIIDFQVPLSFTLAYKLKMEGIDIKLLFTEYYLYAKKKG